MVQGSSQKAEISNTSEAPTSTTADAGRTALLVCSPRPCASTQKGAKGNQWWKREPFHVSGKNYKTVCGIDCSDWLKLERRLIDEATGDQNCCRRCAALAAAKGGGMTSSQSIEEAMSHLGAALMQTDRIEDQIIWEHVRAAHSLLKDVHRKEAEQQRANEVMA